MKTKDELTELEEALRSLPLDKAPDALELMEKLTRNVVRNPAEEKFRRVKLTNAKIAAAIEEAPQIVVVMQEMGWLQEDDSLVLPPSVRLAHEVHVVGIIDAKDHFKKEAEKERTQQMRARKSGDADKEELRKQLEIDRKEKGAEGPVSHGSKANKLGDGPNIMRAGDVGIGKSAGGG